MSIRVVIAEDRHLFAEGLRHVLHGESEGRIEVVGTVENGSQAVDAVDRLSPDVVLMDIRMPVMDGVEATDIIHRRHPNIAIMILTTFDDDDLVFNALRCGANGYVLKTVEPRDLVLAVESVHHGVLYVSPTVGSKLVHLMHPERRREETELRERTGAILSSFDGLTFREAEILALVASAMRNAAIAEFLHISEKTVKNHISNIYDKLGVHERLGLISLVRSHGAVGDSGEVD